MVAGAGGFGWIGAAEPRSDIGGSKTVAGRGGVDDRFVHSIGSHPLRRALKPVIEEVTKGGGSRAEREVATVLRGIERGATHHGGHIPEGPTSYLTLVSRVFQQRPQKGPEPPKPLIVLP